MKQPQSIEDIQVGERFRLLKDRPFPFSVGKAGDVIQCYVIERGSRIFKVLNSDRTKLTNNPQEIIFLTASNESLRELL